MSGNHQQQYGPAGPDRAFTLIEVLVVVAIIALLIAILMPALTAARNQAQNAVCISNLKQVVTGVQTHLLETGMRSERVSTNFGWATPSFVVNKEARAIFTCPADTNPLPMPPLYADVYDGSTYHGRTASDGVFNHVWPPGSVPGSLPPHPQYYLDIQDTVDETGFGRDADTGDYDLLLQYSAPLGATSAEVGIKTVESGWTFKVLSYKARTLWNNANTGGGGGTYRLPLIWMSYGANAAAGLRCSKGNPLLIVENSKPGAFPESYFGKGSFGAGEHNDNLKVTLRFRHGPRLVKKGFGDGSYVVRQNINGAFLDGHVENMPYSRIVDPSPTAQQVNSTGALLWHRDVWLGIRRSGDFTY